MSLPHRTDAEGYDLAVWENPDLWPPETNSDAHAWPAWTDSIRWELGPDLAPAEPTREDLSDFDAWLDQVDGDGYPPRDQVSESELAMLAAGMAIG